MQGYDTLIKCGKIENPEKEKYASEGKGRGGTPGGKRTILLAGCAEVIKSRQIFSLSRRVSDTYIILKGLFRRHYISGNEPEPEPEPDPDPELARWIRRSSRRAMSPRA